MQNYGLYSPPLLLILLLPTFLFSPPGGLDTPFHDLSLAQAVPRLWSLSEPCSILRGPVGTSRDMAATYSIFHTPGVYSDARKG